MKHICTSNWNVLELIALLRCLNIVLKSVFQWYAGDINTSHITVKHSYLLISICSNNHGYIPEWVYSSHLVWTVVSWRKVNTQVEFSTVPRQGVAWCCNANSQRKVEMYSLLNSFVPEWCGCNYRRIIFKVMWRISWAFNVKLLFSECRKTSQMYI